MMKTDNLEELTEKYPLLRSVIDGDTTLEETLDGCEDEFYALIKRGARLIKLDRNLEKGIIKYESMMTEFIEIAHAMGYGKEDMESPDIRKHILMERNVRTAKVCDAGSMVAAFFAFTIVAIPISEFLGNKYFQLSGSEHHIDKIKEVFNYLKDQAKEIDGVIHQKYMTKYLIERPELFRETYAQMSENEQKRVKKKLESMVELGALDMSIMELEKFLKEADQKGE